MKKPPKKNNPRVIKSRPKSVDHSGKQQIFDSISQAAVALGVSASLLKKLKRQGAPGFRNSRVHVGELAPFIEGRESAAGPTEEQLTKEELECRRMRAQCDRLEFKHALEKGDYVLKNDIRNHLTRFCGELVAILRQKLENEWPASLQGKSIPQVRESGKSTVDEILSRFRSHFDTWTV